MQETQKQIKISVFRNLMGKDMARKTSAVCDAGKVRTTSARPSARRYESARLSTRGTFRSNLKDAFITLRSLICGRRINLPHELADQS